MSLFGALQLGGSSLAAQQTGLQVTGNNISNAGTAGYTRQVANLTPGSSTEIAPGQYLGAGVDVSSVQRQANASINESLRDATSGQSSGQTLSTLLNQVQSTFNSLGDNDVAGQLTDFFNSFSTLANDPSDNAQRAVVVQNGVSVAGYLQTLRGQLTTIGSDAQTQIGEQVTQANSLAQSIASLNQQIATSTTAAGGDNALLDQRDQDLSQLSQIMNIRVIDQGNGNLNVLVGSMPLVEGNTSRGVSSVQVPNSANNSTTTKITFADNGDTMNVSGGSLGALVNATNTYLTPAVQTVDTIAAGLINAVNSISTQGQGLSGFSTVAGTTAVSDPTAALNAGKSSTGIAFPPTNGTFDLYIQDTVSGQITTKQIPVNLSGQGAQTSLNSLAASISAAGGGVVTGTVNSAGQLVIASNNSNVTVGFGNDTSGALASLGVNTFFSGSDASNIAVNQVLQNDPSMLAAGQGNVTGSNANALALSQAGTTSVSQLGGQSLTDYYSNYVGALATSAQNAGDDVTAQTTIHDSIYAQQQSVSGVSLDEETVNLTTYQRAFEGTARFISVVDEMMQTVLGLITE